MIKNDSFLNFSLLEGEWSGESCHSVCDIATNNKARLEAKAKEDHLTPALSSKEREANLLL